MKTYIKGMVTGAALSAVLLASAGAWAASHHPGHSPERMLEHMTDTLNLTATQQSQVEILMSENRGTMESDRERMGEIRDELKAMRTDFDAGSAQSLADELGEITSRTSYAMASTQAEIYQLLTPQQREEMDEMLEKREQRMQKRRPARD